MRGFGPFMCSMEVPSAWGTGSTFLNKACSDRAREQLHQAGFLYGAMKMHYLTHARREKHFINVENYSCPGSVWHEHKGSMPSFLLPVDQLQLSCLWHSWAVSHGDQQRVLVTHMCGLGLGEKGQASQLGQFAKAPACFPVDVRGDTCPTPRNSQWACVWMCSCGCNQAMTKGKCTLFRFRFLWIPSVPPKGGHPGKICSPYTWQRPWVPTGFSSH